MKASDKLLMVKIRLPEDIHAGIKALAAEEGRPMNKQIIQTIKETVADKSKK